jgi:hypothetical protein
MKSRPRIGYVPLSKSLQSPGDRRRFVGYARRKNIDFEIASPTQKYDVVVVTETADLPLWTGYQHGKVLFDLIDSYLAVPRTNIKQVLRGTAKYIFGESKFLRFDYRRAVQDLCARADAVVCTTEEQKSSIAPFCSNVHIALDFHGTVARNVKTDYGIGSTVRIVWEGLGVNVRQIGLIKDVLRELASTTSLELVLVTDLEFFRWMNRLGQVRTLKAARAIFQPVRIHQWEETTCAQFITQCDIGIIPIDLSDPFVAGKPENKLLLMWRMGMPVVCSATPAYRRATAAAGIPQLVCKDPSEWFTTLRQMISSEEARRSAAESGQRYANIEWSEASLIRRWDDGMASLGIEIPSVLTETL